MNIISGLSNKTHSRSSVFTLPQVAACGANVDIRVCDASWDARVAQAFNLHVEGGVADLVAESLPVVGTVISQVITPDVALSYHSTLLFCAALGYLHIAMPTCLDDREEGDALDCTTVQTCDVP